MRTKQDYDRRRAAGLCVQCSTPCAPHRLCYFHRARHRLAQKARYQSHPRQPIKPTCHPTRRHYAKGLCHACYDREWRRAGAPPPPICPYCFEPGDHWCGSHCDAALDKAQGIYVRARNLKEASMSQEATS